MSTWDIGAERLEAKLTSRRPVDHLPSNNGVAMTLAVYLKSSVILFAIFHEGRPIAFISVLRVHAA